MWAGGCCPAGGSGLGCSWLLGSSCLQDNIQRDSGCISMQQYPLTCTVQQRRHQSRLVACDRHLCKRCATSHMTHNTDTPGVQTLRYCMRCWHAPHRQHNSSTLTCASWGLDGGAHPQDTFTPGHVQHKFAPPPHHHTIIVYPVYTQTRMALQQRQRQGAYLCLLGS